MNEEEEALSRSTLTETISVLSLECTGAMAVYSETHSLQLTKV